MINKKKVLIIGLSSQDGYFLSKLLLKKNYKVYGTIRKKCYWKKFDIKTFKKIQIIKYSSTFDFLKKNQINEIYNFSNINTISGSNNNPQETFKSIVDFNFNLLEILKKKNTRYFHASSSESLPKNNNRHFNSAYAICKSMTNELIRYYRTKHNVFAVNGILFNHDSFLRKKIYLSSKIFFGVLNYSKTKRPFYLNDLSAKKDRGLVEDFVKIFHKTLNYKISKDWEIGCGKLVTVEKIFLDCCKVFNLRVKKFKKKNFFYYHDLTNNKIILKSKISQSNNRNEIICNTTDLKKYLKILPKSNFIKLFNDYKFHYG